MGLDKFQKMVHLEINIQDSFISKNGIIFEF